MTASFDEPPLVTSDTNIYSKPTRVKRVKNQKMTTWCHLPTILTLRLDRRLVSRVSCILLLCIALITTLFFGAVSRATPGVNQTIGFQGRLLDSNGDIVHDGYYNMQFKIYQGGSGTAAGNPDGTLKWTETYVNNGSATGAVEVKNGFMSVNLGSLNPFGNSIDWNQDTLWLSMNVAGSSTSCTTFNTGTCMADGEMLPMKRLTATPYALNSAALNGKAAENFIQLAQGVQTDATSNTSSIFLNKTGTGNLLQLQNNAVDAFTVTNTGELMFGGGDNHALFINTAAANTDGKQLAISAGDGGSGTGTNGGTLSLQGGNAGGTNGNSGNVQIDAGSRTGSGNLGFISIGATNAGNISIGSNSAAIAQNINIGSNNTDGSTTNVVMGSLKGTSSTKIQAGDGGVIVSTSSVGGFAIHDSGNNYNPLLLSNGSFDFNLGDSSALRVNDTVHGQSVLEVGQNQEIYTGVGSALNVRGTASFSKGITIQGTGTYVTPGGYSMTTAINIPNYTVGQYDSVFAFGLPSTSAASARGMLVADGRTGAHQATIGVLSPDENAIMGLSWNGSNSTGTLSNTANSLALQGNGLNLLTATNKNGSANIGIGNDASAGYALDVTGDVNTSTNYKINGVSTLTNSSLDFSAASAASVSSASGQLLNVNGKAGVNIQNNGTTVATFGSTNIQIGSGAGTGTPTLLTVDKGSSAPGVTGDAYLGSMYYDTTLGKLQCYEADGWGACSANPDNFVSLSPQYSNAVLHGSDPGTLNTDFCSDDMGINNGTSSQAAVCGSHETYNYYDWTSSQSGTATKSIYVTYQLPSNFGGFVSGSTSIMGKIDSSDAEVSYRIYRSTSSGLAYCGTAGTSVSTGAQTTWQKGSPTTQDPADCSFAAGDSLILKINLDSKNNAHAYVSNINFAYKNNSN